MLSHGGIKTIVLRFFAWLLAAMIGVLEVPQLWAPGRQARLEDFVVDAAAALGGFAIATGVGWATHRLRLNPS